MIGAVVALWLDWMMLTLWLEQRLYNATGSDDIMVEIAVDSGRDKRGIVVGTTVILWLKQRWNFG